MHRKKFLANVLDASGIVSLCRTFITANNGNLPILGYHRVKPVTKNYRFDENLISATPEQFLRQMQHIKNHYTPIKLTDIDNYSMTGRWPKRPVIITFDDGFDDNYHHAYPVLKDLAIPATFFLATNYMDTRECFWFDWVVFLLKKLARPVELKTGDTQRSLLITPEDALQQQRAVFGFLKSVNDAERKQLIKQLEDVNDITQRAELCIESRAMTWDQVREMSNSDLFDFGSHSQSHPALNQLGRAELIDELQLSKQRIETELGKTCDTLAYPFGGNSVTTEEVLLQVKHAGYRYACMYQKSYNRREQLKYLQLERIHIEHYLNDAEFAAVLALPNLFAV